VVAFSYGVLAAKIRKEQTGQPSQGRAEDMVQGMKAPANTYIKIGPAPVYIPVHPVKKGVSRRAAGLTDKR
jgi:hypothetical protein